MTTIAYRDGIMAADTQTTAGDIDRGSCQKIWRLSDGSLLGIAGQIGFEDAVMEWIAAGARWQDRPIMPEGATVFGLLIKPNGSAAVFSKEFVLQRIEGPFHAQGSGNELAIGAMGFGATAAEAVAVAMKFDVYTGGRITTLSLAAVPSPQTEETQT